MPFYHGIFTTSEVTERAAKPAQEKADEYIQKTLKEFAEKASWALNVIAAQFQIED